MIASPSPTGYFLFLGQVFSIVLNDVSPFHFHPTPTQEQSIIFPRTFRLRLLRRPKANPSAAAAVMWYQLHVVPTPHSTMWYCICPRYPKNLALHVPSYVPSYVLCMHRESFCFGVLYLVSSALPRRGSCS